jgi:hypothetical protein
MTQEQIKQLAELQNIFEERCSEVTNILGKMDKHCGTSFSHTNTYRLDDTVVMAEGEVTWQYGGYEEVFEPFDVVLLTKSNEELEKYVEDNIQVALAKKKQKEQDLLKKKEEEERKQLEVLKRKYES